MARAREGATLSIPVGSLLVKFLGVVPAIIRDALRARAARRAADAQHSYDVRLKRIEHELRVVEQREQVLLQQAMIRFQTSNLRYPLGEPGRLRSLIGRSAAPAIVVSPVPPQFGELSPDMVHRVHDVLHRVTTMHGRAMIETGAFVSYDAVPAFVSGRVGAQEIAAFEFPDHPAIIVYFEPAPDGFDAFAYLTGMFGPRDGDCGFALPIARYRTAPGRGATVAPAFVTYENGDGTSTWDTVDLTRSSAADNCEVIAYTIAWFIASAVDEYWRLQGVSTEALAEVIRLSGGIGLVARSVPQLDAGFAETGQSGLDDVLPRLEQEISVLGRMGYHFTAELLPDSRLALLLKDDAGKFLWIVGPDYPAKPPELWSDTDEGPFRVLISEEDWSADRTVAQVVEALR